MLFDGAATVFKGKNIIFKTGRVKQVYFMKPDPTQKRPTSFESGWVKSPPGRPFCHPWATSTNSATLKKGSFISTLEKAYSNISHPIFRDSDCATCALINNRLIVKSAHVLHSLTNVLDTHHCILCMSLTCGSIVSINKLTTPKQFWLCQSK